MNLRRILAQLIGATLLSCQHAPLGAAPEQLAQTVPEGFVAQPVVARKYALVIGVENYSDPEFDEVKNALNDAQAVATSLHMAGFDFIRYLPNPPSTDAILAGVTELVQQARPNSQSALMLVFFAGHGVQVDGTNLLVPAGAHRAMLLDESLPVSLLLSKVATDQYSVSVVMLDACRSLNSPDASEWTTPLAPTAVAGFQSIQEYPNTIIELSTSAGKNAQSFSRFDPSHSPFSLALSQQIPAKSASLAKLSERLHTLVKEDMRDAQVPVLVSTAALNQVFLSPGQPEEAADAGAWHNALTENRRNCYIYYVSTYPAGRYAYSAKYLLSLLGNQPTSEPSCILSP